MAERTKPLTLRLAGIVGALVSGLAVWGYEATDNGGFLFVAVAEGLVALGAFIEAGSR